MNMGVAPAARPRDPIHPRLIDRQQVHTWAPRLGKFAPPSFSLHVHAPLVELMLTVFFLLRNESLNEPLTFFGGLTCTRQTTTCMLRATANQNAVRCQK